MAPPTESFLHYIHGESNPAALLLLISAVLLSILFLVFCSFFTSGKRKGTDLEKNGTQSPNTTLTRVTIRLSPKDIGVSRTEQHGGASPMSNRALPSLPETEKTTRGQSIQDPGDSLYDTLDSQPLQQEKPMTEIERPPLVEEPITSNPEGNEAKNEAEDVNKKNIESLYSKVKKKNRPTMKTQDPPVAGNDVSKTPAEEGIPSGTKKEQETKNISATLTAVYNNANKKPSKQNQEL